MSTLARENLEISKHPVIFSECHYSCGLRKGNLKRKKKKKSFYLNRIPPLHRLSTQPTLQNRNQTCQHLSSPRPHTCPLPYHGPACGDSGNAPVWSEREDGVGTAHAPGGPEGVQGEAFPARAGWVRGVPQGTRTAAATHAQLLGREPWALASPGSPLPAGRAASHA